MISFRLYVQFKIFLYVFYYALLLQPRTQALHCFYRDQRQLIIQARKGARPSTLARLVFRVLT